MGTQLALQGKPYKALTPTPFNTGFIIEDRYKDSIVLLYYANWKIGEKAVSLRNPNYAVDTTLVELKKSYTSVELVLGSHKKTYKSRLENNLLISFFINISWSDIEEIKLDSKIFANFYNSKEQLVEQVELCTVRKFFSDGFYLVNQVSRLHYVPN